MGKVQVETDIPQIVNYVATTVSVGSTTTLSPGANATVTNSGTNQNAILDFGIPRGKSAYEQAVEGGYTGTEAEFEQALASDIGTVAGIASDVTQVAGIASAVSNVAANESDVTLVSDNMASVMTTASNIGDVSTVAGVASSIPTVAGDSANISAVAADLTNIDTAATNISAIIAAPTAATNAATSAANAQTWAEGTDAQVAALGGTKSSKGWAARAEELVQSIGQVMHYKGSVSTYADLTAIVDPELGDVYNVLADDSNYAWAGSAWDMIGSSVDTSALQPKTLDTPITVGGVSQTTVEGALGAINTNTDGALKNTATGTNSLTILGTAATATGAINIGKSSKAQGNYGVAIGNEAWTSDSSTVAIGAQAKALDYYATAISGYGSASKMYSIVLGYSAFASAKYAIQLGEGINSTINTMQVWTYPLLDKSTGKIPAARLTAMVGADGVNAGTAGAVPAPTATDNTKFLRGDGTWAEAGGGGSGHVVGEIVSSTLPITDAGFHLLDGALISGSGTYAAFVDYIGDLYDGGSYSGLFETEANWQTAVTAYGVCGKFVYDSVNNTVRLPKITGIIEGTTDTTALGDLVEAGLPNITGQVAIYVRPEDASGVFYLNGTGSNANKTGDYGDKYINFDASRSSSIYGNSATVQPQTIKVLYYIVIATSAKTAIEADIDQIASDLNGKADADLTNCTKPHIVETYVNGTSWYRVYSDGWCEQGGEVSNLNIGAATSTVIFLKAFADTNYTLTFGTFGAGYGAAEANFRCTAYNSTSCTFYNNSGSVTTYKWQACGYIS